MLKRHTNISIIIAVSILLVCSYQMYWLVGQYCDLKVRVKDDITEALRSADFEELSHRVDEITRMKFKGNVKVNMGYDHKQGESLIRSQVKEQDDDDRMDMQEGSTTTVNASSFGNMLRTPDDLKNIGLSMQRGIHMSLDAIKEVDITYLDRVISNKLDSLGLNDEHELLYLRKTGVSPEGFPTRSDTLAKIGALGTMDTDIFSLPISENAEYRIVIPNWHIAVLKKMLPVIIFSLLTLTLLIVTFVYLMSTMRRQREMEEIKTDFTNNITHELKTPIAVAYAANDALLNHDSGDNTPRMNRYLQLCQEQLRLLDRLVEQILSISMDRKKEVLLNLEKVEVDKMLYTLSRTFQLKYPDAIFTIEAAEGLTLESDYMHLSNITGNLIDNAVKYSKDKAEVTLSAMAGPDGECVISVSDKGIGISEKQQKFIFDRFYRVPHGNIHDVKGYGLGLFYVRSMSQRLGGSVSVESALGKGSRFTLKFKNICKNEKNKDIID